MSSVNPTSAVRSQSMAAMLAWAFAALISYASLYPFAGWSGPGVGLAELLTSPLPQYWTWFDVIANAVGYAPLGFLVSFAVWRSGGRLGALLLGGLVCSLLSLHLEWVQSYLPGRIPSNVDWFLNTAGGLMGSALAAGVVQASWIDRWDRWRQTWLVPGAKMDVILLALWPVAALYPSAVPFGLGHIRAHLGAHDFASWAAPIWLSEPLAALAAWASAELPVMTAAGEVLTMALAVSAPCVLACAACRSSRVRAWAMVAVWGMAALAGCVSGALTYGPDHALDWWRPNMWWSLALVAGLCVLALRLTRTALLVLLVACVMAMLWLLNSTGPSAYLDQSLQIWEAGQFIRFHGASQWLGWLWPFVVLGYASVRVVARR
jgi:VanZ family protein